ncbi:uncharacterized protein BDZ83DRAFT_647092 [Colletotrichum acutatum]|uniref:Uncharacterized protein n=1 Tax=Glomerella acutata TaxID=27357 RepID=A0AAD9D1B9_GLOAC|nr:uncharacterized protein BDZ83DRAFT_647092 [Colletotrichum acutatum]KAK1730327.1 hypothetical protein BDZ83DRAFT_647092 [Colletotrichum acutatum]
MPSNGLIRSCLNQPILEMPQKVEVTIKSRPGPETEPEPGQGFRVRGQYLAVVHHPDFDLSPISPAPESSSQTPYSRVSRGLGWNWDWDVRQVPSPAAFESRTLALTTDTVNSMTTFIALPYVGIQLLAQTRYLGSASQEPWLRTSGQQDGQRPASGGYLLGNAAEAGEVRT